MSSIYAQTSKLEGTWVLESVSVVKIVGNDSVKVSPVTLKDNVYVGIYDRLVFNDNNVKLISPESEYIGPFAIENSLLLVSFLAAPYSWEYTVSEDNKLCLVQVLRPKETSLKEVHKISLIYKKDTNADATK